MYPWFSPVCATSFIKFKNRKAAKSKMQPSLSEMAGNHFTIFGHTNFNMALKYEF